MLLGQATWPPKVVTRIGRGAVGPYIQIRQRSTLVQAQAKASKGVKPEGSVRTDKKPRKGRKKKTPVYENGDQAEGGVSEAPSQSEQAHAPQTAANILQEPSQPETQTSSQPEGGHDAQRPYWPESVIAKDLLEDENTMVYEAPVYTRMTGYTPFEYVDFSDNQMRHEVTIEVDVDCETAFEAWQVQSNYGLWFDVIGKTIIHPTDTDLTSYFFYYQWGHLPALELFTTLAKRLVKENYLIGKDSMDGMPLSVAVYFDKVAKGKCKVNLRVGYLLPNSLMYYVGPVGVWGDVNDILLDGMAVMKEEVERGAYLKTNPVPK